MSVVLQEKLGCKVCFVFIPEVFNWWSNLDKTESLSKSCYVVTSVNVVSVDDQVSLVAFGNKIFL